MADYSDLCNSFGESAGDPDAMDNMLDQIYSDGLNYCVQMVAEGEMHADELSFEYSLTDEEIHELVTQYNKDNYDNI